MKTNIGCWFEIYVADIERAKEFYQTVFALELKKLEAPDMEMWQFPELNSYGSTGALVKMEGVNPGPGGSLIYLACDDCTTEESRVEACGGKVIRPKFSIGKYGNIALIIDSEGNMVGLHSEK